MSTFAPAETLRQHRPLLLACEAIGWFHMAGKARMEFLRHHGGDAVRYEYEKWHDAEQPPFPWDELLGWVKNWQNSSILQGAWPDSIKDFTEKHRAMNPGILGLLQAGHGMASGIEKNVPTPTSGYLSQSLPHMWLSSPFGHPKRNLFADPPEVLTERGWKQVVEEIRQVLDGLKQLATNKVADVSRWADWRDWAIGPQSYLRRAFLSTLAETRLPNNDVTLWDQSYVAAALFKSAVAGAILNNQGFPRGDNKDNNIKRETRWRLLTVSIGTDHYEARAVKIGDWTGARAALDEFFDQVAQLIEVDLAIGSLLYRDSSVAIFSFPGERWDETVPAPWLNGWENWLQEQVDTIAQGFHLETPPFVRLSDPTRSLVPLVRERREALKITAVPLHKEWKISRANTDGHVCPVCQVRLNGDPTNKGKPCEVCLERRHHRRNDWLGGRLGYDTIWFEEVADSNNRIAFLTLSFDLEPWLNGKRVDSLRAQAISEWAKFNPTLSEKPNPIDAQEPFESLEDYIKNKLSTLDKTLDKNDPVLRSLQEGYPHESDWPKFFQKIVEDRAEAPDWNNLNDDQRAAWLAHQLFRKLPSPGRVNRFWREAQEFFEELLREFRQIAARSDNPWRVRRLLIKPVSSSGSGWQDRTLYDGRWRGVQFSLVYMQALNGFVTASNLARLLKPEEPKTVLREGQEIALEEEDTFERTKQLTIGEVKEIGDTYSHLGIYHPVIPLELSPLRFRVVLPLEMASECVDLALSRWREQFARVWDRLPLHVGVVAFDRTLPFQAVVEATRNLEDILSQGKEIWRVERHEVRQGIVALQLQRQDGQTTLRTVPVTVADGREDTFYPYVAVEDQSLRYPRDFRHPNGQIYRHMADLRVVDGIRVFPARVGFLFMDTAGARFQIPKPLYLEDWEEMRKVWRLVERIAPSQTALQRFWSALNRLEQEWLDSTVKLSPDLWRDTVRALIAEHLEAKGAALEALTEAALHGLLQRALEWHMTVLKTVQGG